MVRTTKQTKRLVITLSQHMKKKLEEKAQKNGCSQAEVIRYALMKLIEVRR
jgi:metal-responsive CopG/Arc/MetJ family transcriptional regulator